MNKLTLIAAAAIAGSLSLAALPAMAAPSAGGAPYCNSDPDQFAKWSDTYAQQLKGQGVNASSISEWNGCIRAVVTDSSGHTSMAFYDPDTLRLIDTLGGSDMRAAG